MATSDATKNEWIALQTCTPDDGSSIDSWSGDRPYADDPSLPAA